MRMTVGGLILSIVALTATAVFSDPQTIGDLAIQRSGFVYNRMTDTFDATVTIRNTGAMSYAAPMHLVVDAVAPLSVSVYNSSGKTALGRPYVVVPLSGFVLAPAQSVTVPVRFVNLGKSYTAASFSVQAVPLDPAATAQLQIAATMDRENGGAAVDAGYVVKADGTTRAVTDVDGHAAFSVPTSTSQVAVSYPPNLFGSAMVDGLAAGEKRSVTLVVGDSGELGADSTLRIDRLHHSMLPRNVPQLVLRFFQNEKVVLGDLIESVELRDPVSGAVNDISNLFSLRSDGGLYASSAAFFAVVGALEGKKLLFAQVLDKQGVPHLKEVSFYIAQFTVKGKLSSPPSQPGLPLAGIPIEVTVLNTDIAFQTESAADGSFPLPQLTAGSLSIKATLADNGIEYLGYGTAVVSGNIIIDLKMRGAADIANNVSAISVSPL